MFLSQHKAIHQRVRDVMSDINKLSDPEFDDAGRRADACVDIKLKLLSLLKLDEALKVEVEQLLAKFDKELKFDGGKKAIADFEKSLGKFEKEI